MELWKGRFKKDMHQAIRKFNSSLNIDIKLLPYDVRLNRTWAQILHESNILTKTELHRINNALNEILNKYQQGIPTDNLEDEDVHSLVERLLTEKLGEIGKKIHTGKSRNDQVATDILMWLRDSASEMKNALLSLISRVVEKADACIEIVIPAYTHLQRAQPILFSHYLMSLGFFLKDDVERIEALKKYNLCPLGSGAVAGCSYPINREKLANMLGFDAATDNSIHAVSSRDALLEFASAAAIIMLHLSRYAEDLIIWSSSEFGFVELDDSTSTGSSMMPQKKNPDPLELIRGKTAKVLGCMQSIFTLFKGLPLSYAKDMQEDKRIIFEIASDTTECIRIMTLVISSLKINPNRMKAALDIAIYATDIADYLTKRGVPFREAHQTTGRIISSAEQGSNLAEELAKLGIPKEDIQKLIDANRSIKKRNTKGGTSPASVNDQIELLKTFLEEQTHATNIGRDQSQLHSQAT